MDEHFNFIVVSFHASLYILKDVQAKLKVSFGENVVMTTMLP